MLMALSSALMRPRSIPTASPRRHPPARRRRSVAARPLPARRPSAPTVPSAPMWLRRLPREPRRTPPSPRAASARARPVSMPMRLPSPSSSWAASEVRGERAAAQDRPASKPSKKGTARSGGLANGRKREDDRSRPERSRRDDRRRSGREDRSDRPRSDRGDSARNRGGRSGRDAWRNYDEPSERRGRGGRGGRGGQPGNSARGGRGGSYEQRPGAPRSGRRPGDRGGRR